MANFKNRLSRILRTLPPFRKFDDAITTLHKKLDEAEIENNRLRIELGEARQSAGSEKLWVPTGHFYSPIPSLALVEADSENIFAIPPAIRGVSLNENRQLEVLESFRKLYPEQPFTPTKTASRRYFFENPNYSYGDGIALYCMIRHLSPRRIIEVGSGYSSAAMLDVNELFFNNSIACTFIDPYPQLMRSLLKDGDRERIQIIGQKVQDVDANMFRELGESDILFIDSSHVSKTGSDVNYIVFKILPLLKQGVYIHIHDISYPFEYSTEWIREGRSWNETYLMRAFLQYNRTFDIEYFSSYLMGFHRDIFETGLPLCLKNEGGHLWLKKAIQDPVLDRVSAPLSRKPRVVPAQLNPSRPELRWLLGEGWHDGEGDHCWMEDRAEFRIAGPTSTGQYLRIQADNPHRDGANLSVTIDSVPLPPVHFSRPGQVEAEFSLPAALVGRSELKVELSVDKIHSAPNDTRKLAMSVIHMEVR